MGLRERNRHATMRATQREALAMFRERGFAAVTVEDVAARLEMSPSTVYRHFGTKEGVVVWDEHDAALDRALDARLDRGLDAHDAFRVLREVFVDTLAQRYTGDQGFQLERVAFVYATEALHAAAVEAQFRDRDALTAALADRLRRADADAAPLIAGAALLALDVAVDRWQQRRGREDLGTLIAAAFSTLEALGPAR